MEEIKLDVQIRNEVGTRRVKKVRAQDFVPAVVYGGKKAPTTIQVDRRTFQGIMRHHKGQSVVFRLNVMEGEKTLRDYSAILKDEQHDPVKDHLTHIDFYRISMKEEIEVNVPIVHAGEAIGVRQDGGSLDHAIWELDVVCLPTNIPEKIEVDVSALQIGDSVHLEDITLPEGVKTKHDPKAILFTVVPPMKEEVELPSEEGEEPEVIKEKKEKAADQEEAAAGGEEKKE